MDSLMSDNLMSDEWGWLVANNPGLVSPRSKEACDYIERVALVALPGVQDAYKAILLGVQMFEAMKCLRKETYGQSDE